MEDWSCSIREKKRFYDISTRCAYSTYVHVRRPIFISQFLPVNLVRMPYLYRIKSMACWCRVSHVRCTSFVCARVPPSPLDIIVELSSNVAEKLCKRFVKFRNKWLHYLERKISRWPRNIFSLCFENHISSLPISIRYSSSRTTRALTRLHWFHGKVNGILNVRRVIEVYVVEVCTPRSV